MLSSCYNTGQENAPAMLATSESVTESVKLLREDESDMTKDSTPVFPSTKGRRKSTLEMIGQKFGRLTVIDIGAPAYVKVQCECGTIKEVKPKEIRGNRHNTVSCGCLNRERSNAGINRTHGQSKTPTYKVWLKLRSRCMNPRDEHYKDYGARGITVCERWQQSFENFLADMGERPTRLTIERIDNNKGYSPENCRWATMREQSNNRRSNVLITAHNQTLNVAQWAEKTGLSISTIHRRLKQGSTNENAIRPKRRRPRQ